MENNESMPQTEEVEQTKLKNSQDKNEKIPSNPIAGFFRRFIAFGIDCFIAAIPLIFIGFGFRDFWYQLGPGGRIFGYLIMILYFGIGNSRLGRRDTFGKQIMGIAVVDRNRRRLPIEKSLFRSFILASIYMFNDWAISIFQNAVGSILVGTIVLGGGLALLYGFIFNRITRQSIHDFLTDSFVIIVNPEQPGAIPETPDFHKKISYGLVLVGFVISTLSLFVTQLPAGFQPTFGIIEDGELAQMASIQGEIFEQGDHFSVGVRRTNNFNGATGVESKDLNIEIWTKTVCSKNRDSCVELYNSAARVAFDEFENIDELTGLRISVVNRFDLGLASGQEIMGSSLRIEDWKKELNIE